MEESIANISSTAAEKSLSAGKDGRRKEYIRWGRFTSADKDNPDVLEIKPQIKHIYTTEYSQCTDVAWKVDGIWIDAVLPLKSNNSTNASLINQWIKARDQGRPKMGKAVKILTWMDISKNGNPIRRHRLVV